MLEALIGTPLGIAVRLRLRGCELHAPAHMDAQVLLALARLVRDGELGDESASAAVAELAVAPIVRHDLARLAAGAWSMRSKLRLLDGFYVALSSALDAPLVATDERLARASAAAELV